MSSRGRLLWSSQRRGERHGRDKGIDDELGEVKEEGGMVLRSLGSERRSSRGKLEGWGIVELVEERTTTRWG